MKYAELFVFLILFSFMLFSPRIGISQDSLTYTVGPPGSGADYTRIQDAVDAASDGDTIVVWDWLYVENVIVDKALNILGTNPNTTIVSASNSLDVVFLITHNYVSLSQFKIEDATSAAGIKLSNINYVTISNNCIENNDIGIDINHSSECSIFNNSILSSKSSGIQLISSYSNNLSGNNIIDNVIGINILQSENNIFSRNEISSSSGAGLYAMESSNNEVSENIFPSNENGIHLRHSSDNWTIYGNEVHETEGTGISLYRSHYAQIIENNIYSNGNGVGLADSDFNFVNNNQFSSNEYDGISVGGANNEILNNYVASNGYNGMSVSGETNKVFNNTILFNQDGIDFGGDLNEIINNNVSLNHNGIVSWVSSSASSNLISRNVIKSNHGYGIVLYSSGDRQNNTISNNDISFNSRGLLLDGDRVRSNNIIENDITSNDYQGICISSSNFNLVEKNKITTNNIGLEVLDSENNTVSINDLTENGIGIFLSGSSKYNTLSSNIVSSNLDFGICINQSSHLNWIYNNYFSNTANARDDGYNYWNLYPKVLGINILGGPFLGGNYWNDYLGVDNSIDGLGDTNTPYNSNGNIKSEGDRLPLVATVSYTHIGDIVDIEGQNHPIHIATNSTIPLGSFVPNETVFNFNVTNNGNAGYCSLMIEKYVNGSAYLIYVDSYEVEYTAASNGTHYFLYFTFSQDFHNILVTTEGSIPWISEFPSWIIFPLFLSATFVAIIIKKMASN